MVLLPALSSVLCLVLVASTAFALPDAHWSLFKSKFGKSYKDADEEAMRRDIFIKNKEHVDYFNAHKAHDAGYTKGLNHMSDWTPEEMAMTKGVRRAKLDRPAARVEKDSYLDKLLNSDEPVPDSHDWRTVEGRVTSVKAEGSCHCSWAFSAIGMLEGQEKTYGINETKSLSVQEVLDCSRNAIGCFDGNPGDALIDIGKLGGLESDESYPYTGHHSVCKLDQNKIVITNKAYEFLPDGDEEALKTAVYRYGPVAVSILVTENFLSYKSGVLNDEECMKQKNPITDREVLVVGYGTDKATKKDYWIVKNSAGTSYGMDGYVLMSRNADNQCAIASYAMVATF